MNDLQKTQEKLSAFQQRGGLLLAIETSCDETAAAVLCGERQVMAEVVVSQVDLHAKFGGVVPEVAARQHSATLLPAVSNCLEKANVTLQQINAIAVTCGPGLVGALLTGVNYAKGLAFALGVPLLGVHHIKGHIAANFLAHPTLQPPFVCLVVSGGHTHLVRVDEGYTLLGKTCDDAAGEAFDKAARMLGLSYPGGPNLDALAETGNDSAIPLPKAKCQNPLDFSFSGLKTALWQTLQTANRQGKTISMADAAASFRKAVVDALVKNAVAATKESGLCQLALAGGVASNRLLRKQMADCCQQEGIALYMPPLHWCTDNAAMIGCAGWRGLLNGEVSPQTLNASPSLPLFSPSPK